MVMNSKTASRMLDSHPSLADRIYWTKHLPDNKIYLVDLDVIDDLMALPARDPFLPAS
jgi:hypothetical protein